jgi:Abi-like protein
VSCSEHDFQAWVSVDRVAPFLQACGGTHQDAVALYLWHARLGGACHAHLHHFEVLLRNAIDRAIVEHTASDEWLLDERVLGTRAIRQVREARDRLKNRSDADPRWHGDLVAALPLGFWRAMFRNQYEPLWRSALHTAFPHRMTGQERRDLGNRLEAARKFRNRVAHHDSLLSVDVEARLRELDTVARAIDPGAAAWIAQHSEVPRLLSERPCDAESGEQW